MIEAGKDAAVVAAGAAGVAIHQSWQDTAGDFILIASAVLVTLRIVHLLWQWVRGKKPD